MHRESEILHAKSTSANQQNSILYTHVIYTNFQKSLNRYQEPSTTKSLSIDIL